MKKCSENETGEKRLQSLSRNVREKTQHEGTKCGIFFYVYQG
jgi:hypothetical protein